MRNTTMVTARLKRIIMMMVQGMLSVMNFRMNILSKVCAKYINAENNEISAWKGYINRPGIFFTTKKSARERRNGETMMWPV